MMKNMFFLIIFAFLMTSICNSECLPGKGSRLVVLSDDFENPSWVFNYNGNKTDGLSSNGLWLGSFRGVPEILERVLPPSGGISGQSGALRISSYDPNTVGLVGYDGTANQDDFVGKHYNLTFGRYLERADLPSVVVRIYMPAVSELSTEDYYNTIGFRMEARTLESAASTDSYGRYYPSIWTYHYKSGGVNQMYFAVRLGNGYTDDVLIENSNYIFNNWAGGWISLGICFDSIGVGHYFIKQGVSDFTASDEVYNTTLFPNGKNPHMDYLRYHFISLGYPWHMNYTNRLNYYIDDIAVYAACSKDWQLKTDFNQDCKIDMKDLELFLDSWLDCYPESAVYCN